jgi:cardiolipin synthase
MKGFVRWVTGEFIPWVQGRMFRTGIPPDETLVVTNRVFTVANAITFVRLLALPFFVVLAARHAWLWAFLLLGGLAVLDSLDGYVARRFKQTTKLGNALDPVTDRATVITVSVTLVATGIIPLWLAAAILARDVVLLAMVGVLHRLGRPLPVSRVPVTRVGKLATAALLVGIPLLVLSPLRLPGRSVIHAAALLLTLTGVALYYVALGQYAKAGITRLPPAGQRPHRPRQPAGANDASQRLRTAPGPGSSTPPPQR